jgi:hypothetical protein
MQMIRVVLLAIMVGLASPFVCSPTSAGANAQGFRFQGGALATMTRVDMTRDSGTSWSVPSGNWEYEWLGAQDDSCGGCILQVGYAKYAANDGPTNCPMASTNGVIKLEYEIPQSGSNVCFGGININEGDDYAFKIIHGPVGSGSQCDSTHWCIYFHGVFAHMYSPGLDATADDVEVAGEFLCNSCMTSSTAMRVNYGATNASTGQPWQATEGSSMVLITSAVAGTSNTTCSGSSNSVWVINPITVNSKWDVYWKNGGTNC